MPRYSYRCLDPKCPQDIFEMVLPMADSDKKIVCPCCQGPSDRVFTAPQIEVYGGTPQHHRRG
jgi:putative FmdB family regulatory protein